MRDRALTIHHQISSKPRVSTSIYLDRIICEIICQQMILSIMCIFFNRVTYDLKLKLTAVFKTCPCFDGVVDTAPAGSFECLWGDRSRIGSTAAC